MGRKSLSGKGLGIPVSNPQKPSHEYFLALLKKNTPVKEAKVLAGFSPHTKTKAILATKSTMVAAKTTGDANVVLQARKDMARGKCASEAREILSKTEGHEFVDNAEKLVEIRDDVQCPGNVAISAIKEHNAMMGNHAPVKTEIESKSLVIELGNLSREELQYIHDNGMSI